MRWDTIRERLEELAATHPWIAGFTIMIIPAALGGILAGIDGGASVGFSTSSLVLFTSGPLVGWYFSSSDFGVDSTDVDLEDARMAPLDAHPEEGDDGPSALESTDDSPEEATESLSEPELTDAYAAERERGFSRPEATDKPSWRQAFIGSLAAGIVAALLSALQGNRFTLAIAWGLSVGCVGFLLAAVILARRGRH
jgi:hypothetical protein